MLLTEFDIRILALIATAMQLLTAWSIWRNKDAGPSRLGGFVLLSGALWTLGVALELAASDLAAKTVWSMLQWIGVVTLSPLWYLYANRNIGRKAPKSWAGAVVLIGIPVLTLLLAMTNSGHGLLRQRVPFTPFPGKVLMDQPLGPWGWVFLGYSFAVVVMGSALLLRATCRRATGIIQALFLLGSAWTPIIAILFFAQTVPGNSFLALTAILFAIAGCIAAWALAAARIRMVVPLARESAMEAMRQGVFVVDPRERIVDINGQAALFLGRGKRELIGRRIGEVWPECPADLRGVEGPIEVAIGADPRRRICDATVSPLADWRGRLLGHIVVLHDVTERLHEEEELERSYQELEFLSETAMALVEFPAEEDIYQFIAERLRQLVGRCVVTVDLFDGQTNTLRVRAVAFDDTYKEQFERQPWKALLPQVWDQLRSMSYKVPQESRERLLGGRLVKIPDTISQIGFGQIPPAVISQIEQVLDLGDSYAMGFVRDGELVGDCLIVLRQGEVLENRHVVETLISQASVALQRKRAEDGVRASLAEKEVLLKEINHRVKNNLQVISSMLHLQSKTVSDPAIIDALEDSRNRIRSMALVHEKLYRSRDLAHINFSDYLRTLSGHLFRSYNVQPNTVRLESSIEDVDLGIDTAMPCGLIINELLSNALKYAFPAGCHLEAPPTIRLELNRVNSDVRLSVADNGVEIATGSSLPSTSSLGLQLVHTLAKQLDATVEFNCEHGVQFAMSFPAPDAQNGRQKHL